LLAILSGVWLVFIGVSGNFIAETLGCKTQKLLSESVLAKQAVVFAVLFFALSALSELSLLECILFAAVSQLVFILLTKQNESYTLFSLFLLLVLYSLARERQRQDEPAESLDVAIYCIASIFGISLVVGFYKYYAKQKAERLDSFEWSKFLLGTLKCDSLQEDTGVTFAFDDL